MENNEGNFKYWAKMVLPTLSAVALWKYELVGQISDGMWENSSPQDHWIYWCHTEAVCGGGECVPHVESSERRRPLKVTYGFERLKTYVLKRMREIGAWGVMCAFTKRSIDDVPSAVQYGQMPATFSEFVSLRPNDPDLSSIDEKTAELFYIALGMYTTGVLDVDLKSIKAAMKDVSWSE